MSENKTNWKELGFSEKTKLSLSIFLVISSVLLGFISFILLNYVPSSVIGLNGCWLSCALGLLGITSYFSNQLVKMETEVKRKINELNNVENKYKTNQE